MAISLLDVAPDALQALNAANRSFTTTYPGPSAQRQPVHTAYGGAQLFHADIAQRFGRGGLQTLSAYGSDPRECARGVGSISDAAPTNPDELRVRCERDPELLRSEQP